MREASQARGRRNPRWRALAEALLDLLQYRGWLAQLSWRCGWHGKLSVTRYCVELPAQFAATPGFRLAFLSDFHAGPTTAAQVFAAAFAHLQQEPVDLLLLGGDFVSGAAPRIHALLPYLQACQSRLGKFAVWGNHDLWTDSAYLQTQLAAAGVSVLCNQAVCLPAPFAQISLYGMDDPWTGRPLAPASSTTDDIFRLILMHAPDGLQFLAPESFELAFAGHTHGGQLARANGKAWYLPGGKLSRRYPYGDYIQPDSPWQQAGRLIVSRGLGCSNLPLRLNADPELVLCEFVPAADSDC